MDFLQIKSIMLHLESSIQLYISFVCFLYRKKLLAIPTERENLTSKIVYYGLWQQTSGIDEKLSELSTMKEKRDALDSTEV